MKPLLLLSFIFCFWCAAKIGQNPSVQHDYFFGCRFGPNFRLEDTTLFNNKKYITYAIVFDSAATTLLSKDTIELNRIYRFLKRNPKVVVEIGEIIDCVPSDNYDYSIEYKRSAAIVQYLLNKGVDKLNIFIKESHPEYKCTDNNPVYMNRRVEMKIMYRGYIDIK